MNPLRFHLKAGAPIYEQVLYAARKAIVGGDFRAGEAFPSVRVLAEAYGINPNTVQKAVNALKAEGLIEIHPGVGTKVCALPKAAREDKTQLLNGGLEVLVLRAKQLRLTQQEVIAALREHWETL